MSEHPLCRAPRLSERLQLATGSAITFVRCNLKRPNSEYGRRSLWHGKAKARPSLVPSVLAALALSLLLGAAPSFASDRHAGYYYPPAASTEVYEARAITMTDANRRSRIQFVAGLTQQLLLRPYPPEHAIFAKGDEAEKLIIVGIREGSIGTIYRARALLATMTTIARSSSFFNEFGVQDLFTFFDMAKLFGFKQITITDGDSFSHQIILK